ncbi:hypothetical protein BN137_3303 [Cronobacter condimenti 1330]|uniref:Uncharacterized protein n=1 Tax=Cronobacter condimenti 1330 TaxID=1073999 RepID=K8ADQ3_9ENTR|nr:hypothetical protein BN137_3303 [Cronobacter condimenti 1330]
MRVSAEIWQGTGEHDTNAMREAQTWLLMTIIAIKKAVLMDWLSV